MVVFAGVEIGFFVSLVCGEVMTLFLVKVCLGKSTYVGFNMSTETGLLCIIDVKYLGFCL